jgi:hypothetical protein
LKDLNKFRMHLKHLKFQRREEFMMNKIKLEVLNTKIKQILLKMIKMNKIKIQEITVICINSKVLNKKKLMNKIKQKNFKSL